MKGLVSAVAAALCVGVAVAKERVEERTLSRPAAIAVETHRGFVSLEAAPDEVARVQVVAVTAWENEAEAKRMLAQVRIDWMETRDRLAVRVTSPREAVRFFWQEAERVELEIKILVPRGTQVEVATRDGGVEARDLAAHVSVKCGFGPVSFRQVDGSVRVRNDEGDVVVSRCTGDVDVATKRGAVRVGTVFGRAVLAATNGDVEILSARRGLWARATAGDIAAGVPRQFVGEGSFRASGGSITLKIDPEAKLTLSACSVWGKVRATEGRFGLPLAVEAGGLGRGLLRGTINGGGATVKARASGGQVWLVGETPPFTETLGAVK